MSFVHLHTHTHYSFLQGLGTPKKMVYKALELGMKSVALTDTGNLYGAFEFYKYAKEAGVQAIVGVECIIASKGRKNKDKDNYEYQIVLLAKNFEWYQNLIQIVTESYLTGFYFKARVDFELLETYSSGLIALSGNHLGEISQHITTGKSDVYIKERLDYYTGLFGKDHFYLELIEHPDRGNQGKINDGCIRLSRTYGTPVVATNDVFYMTSEDAEAQDLLACISDGRSIEDPDRPTLIEGNYSLRSPDEMAELFSYIPEALKNTEKIAGMIHLEIPYGKTLIPTFELDSVAQASFEKYQSILPPATLRMDSEEWNLRSLCYSGLNRRYNYGLTDTELDVYIHKIDIGESVKRLSDMSLDELLERSKSYQTPEKRLLISKRTKKEQDTISRLEYELTVVDLMGFNGYFNIVADFINWAKNHDIPVWPGRGSAAGALLAFLSGITDIDPLPYQLLFERFLNPSRISMPDIDVDFADEDRDKVLEYVREKYGSDRVAQICTFGTMAARAAVKDAGKALGIPFAEMNRLAALIPSKPGTKLRDALDTSVEFRQAYQSEPRYKKVIDNALKLEGTIRQLGVHACAVIIAPEPMTKYCALQHPPKDTGSIVTQLSQYPIEDLGLLKMDFLGLRNLTIMKRCITIVRDIHRVEIDLLKINYEDKKVFKVFADGDTTGVFQFESSGMRKYLRDLRPNTFEDIIVMVSLYRPGPIAFIPTYIERKHGREKVAYPHPSLEAILKPTQGIAVYQEQIMQLVQAFAGFSLGQADILRRAIGKKKIDLLMEQKEKFITAAKSQGHPEKLANYIFEDIIEPFAGYGFNKSHAACYSMISYQTAYLKAYYPTEFMTALMVSDEEDTERITLEIDECRRKGIDILPPDINESRKHFTYIDPHHIRFGLKAVKGLGEGPIDAIQKGRGDRPYESMLDVIRQTDGDVINKKSLEALILSGALDRLGERASLLASMTKITAYAKEYEKKSTSAQIGLFDTGGSVDHAHLDFSLERAAEMGFEEKILGEKASIWYAVSGHPLDGLGRFIQKRTIGAEHIKAFVKALETQEIALSLPPSIDSSESSESDDIIPPESSEHVPMSTLAPLIVEEVPEIKEKKEREKPVRVRYIGVINSVRKVQTKTGKMMAIGMCESTDFRFSVVIFPKDYETLGGLLEDNKIILVEGNLKCDLSTGEISVVAQAIKANTITSMRTQAQEMGLFDASQRVYSSVPLDDDPSSRDLLPLPVSPLELTIPALASKQDLLDLKTYLQGLSGNIPVRIFLSGNSIDTKLCIGSRSELESWAKTRWGDSRIREILPTT